MKFFLVNGFAVVLLLWVFPAMGQELNCNLLLNDERVQSQERQVFRDMQTAISQFMNTTKWTREEFREEERIKCNILITLRKSSTINNFQADVQVQSIRPVYGTDYETPILNYLDTKWSFTYAIDQPLIFAENTFTTELTSLLAFYAYIIIGLDFDTFSMLGGGPYYERALNIVNNSLQANNGPGWNPVGDSRDRYWLSENLNSPQFIEFREGLYEYHRLALDEFDNDQDEARKKILLVLEKMERVRNLVPGSIVLNAFFDAKAPELIHIFSQGNMETRNRAIEILTRIDPTNTGNYRKALRQNQ
jgi:hypothetical protein